MKKGRSCYAPAQGCLYALGSLAVPLRCLFDRWSRPLQVLRCHNRMDLYGRVQSEEKRFRHSGDLGGVVHVNNKVSTPCSFHVRKVRRFGVDLLKDRLNSLAHVTAPSQFISLVVRETEREHEAHLHYSFLPARKKTPADSISFTQRNDATQRILAHLTKVYAPSYREGFFSETGLPLNNVLGNWAYL